MCTLCTRLWLPPRHLPACPKAGLPCLPGPALSLLRSVCVQGGGDTAQSGGAAAVGEGEEAVCNAAGRHASGGATPKGLCVEMGRHCRQVLLA